MWHAIIAWLVHAYHAYFVPYVGPFLFATLIPSIIAGLSTAPTPKRMKAIAWFQVIMKFVGWATFRDQPGTYKLPAQEFFALLKPLLVALWKKLAPPAALLLALLSAFLARPARADVPQFSMGPSAQFFRLGAKPLDPGRLNLGNTYGIDVLAAGLGWGFHYNPPAMVRGQVCWLSVFGDAFASFSGLPSSGGLAVMGGVETYNGLFGFGVGYKIFELYDTPGRPMEGLFAGGNGGIRNLFFGVHLAVNLLFGPVSKLPTSVRLGGPPPPNYWFIGDR